MSCVIWMMFSFWTTFRHKELSAAKKRWEMNHILVNNGENSIKEVDLGIFCLEIVSIPQLHP
jgi:hypothetical protein